MRALSSRRPAVAGFAIFTLVMVMAFSGLGIWQLQRRVEKHALIARLNERLAAALAALRRVHHQRLEHALVARAQVHALAQVEQRRERPLLARGEEVCPGQVVVTPRTSPPACQAAANRSGAMRSPASYHCGSPHRRSARSSRTCG